MVLAALFVMGFTHRMGVVVTPSDSGSTLAWAVLFGPVTLGVGSLMKAVVPGGQTYRGESKP